MRLRISPGAEQDLREITDSISVADPKAAVRVIQALMATIAFLRKFPNVGTRLERISPGLRVFPASKPARNYVIFFRVTEDCIDVARVVHGRRDWRILWKITPR